MLSVLICAVHSTVSYYFVTHAFQSESTLYSCLNVKELLARNRCNIWSLSYSNGIHDIASVKYSQMHRMYKYLKHSSIIWPVWLNGWVFVYELSGHWFESHCCHLNPDGNYLFNVNSGNARTMCEYYLNHSNLLFQRDLSSPENILFTSSLFILHCEIGFGCDMI